MRASPAHSFEQGKLPLVAGAKRDVAALARQLHPAIAGPDKPGDTESGAGPEHQLGRMLHRLAAADLMELGTGKMRKRERERREIVEHEHVVQSHCAAKLLAGEGPWPIGKVDRIGGDGARDRQRRLLGPRREAAEIVAKRSGQALIIGAADGVNRGELERVEIGQGEARMGAADIGNQRQFRHSVPCLHQRSCPVSQA